MNVEPCSVCGGIDMNLVDGFYYCVECGTQDVNAMETVVEHTALAEGTFAFATSRKYTTILKDAIEMSGEWHKWHAYNFILSNLADEVVKVGAESSFKKKVLWIWTRYVCAYQEKEDLGISSSHDKENQNLTKLFAENYDDSSNSNSDGNLDKKKKGIISDGKYEHDINIVTKSLLLAILYIALNLDRSDIQLSHMLRFIKEGRISFLDCTKFVPKELDTKSIPHWLSFTKCIRYTHAHSLRALAMTLFKRLNLGVPLVPSMRKIVQNHVKELCLPDQFSNLVYSLMIRIPCDNLEINEEVKMKLVRIPDYEGVAMGYVLVALKMCFGLDGIYEVKLSEVIDKMNTEENYVKSHKFGKYSEATDRLFSFREWTNYLQCRKILLSRYYLPMAQQYFLDVDDNVLMEQLGERTKRKMELRDEVMVDILNKIPMQNEATVIPKSQFIPTITPKTTYTELIVDHIEDPAIKLLISEDFSQYSLKYACESVKLKDGDVNIVKGVDESNKAIKPVISSTIVEAKPADLTPVFVKYSDDKDWLKHKVFLDGLIEIEEKETKDYGYESPSEEESKNEVDSDAETVIVQTIDSVKNDLLETISKIEPIDEEIESVNIFDDRFEGVKLEDAVTELDEVETNVFENNRIYVSENDRIRISHNFSETSCLTPVDFDPNTFNREETIKQIILYTCREYKIPIPQEYNPREPRKRKPNLIITESGQSEPKKKKIMRCGEKKREVDEIMALYVANLAKDHLTKAFGDLRNLFDTSNDRLEDTADGNINDNLDITSTANDDSVFHENNVLDLNVTNNTEGNHEFENRNHTTTGLNSTDHGTDEPIIDEGKGKQTVKEAYQQFQEEFNLDSAFDLDDPVLEKIIIKSGKDCSTEDNVEEIENTICAASDDDEEPEIEAFNVDDFEPLIPKPENIETFKYWFRHYRERGVGRSLEINYGFDVELTTNCPSSFNFVLRECAEILDCSLFRLYKVMQDIENCMIVSTVKKRGRKSNFCLH